MLTNLSLSVADISSPISISDDSCKHTIPFFFHRWLPRTIPFQKPCRSYRRRYCTQKLDHPIRMLSVPHRRFQSIYLEWQQEGGFQTLTLLLPAEHGGELIAANGSRGDASNTATFCVGIGYTRGASQTLEWLTPSTGVLCAPKSQQLGKEKVCLFAIPSGFIHLSTFIFTDS